MERPSHVEIREAVERGTAELRAFFLAELASRDRALALQAVEYERRLTLLNGEHDTLAAMRDSYVLRVVYDKDMEKIAEEKALGAHLVAETRQNQELATAANRRNYTTAITAAACAIVGWGISVVLHFVPQW